MECEHENGSLDKQVVFGMCCFCSHCYHHRQLLVNDDIVDFYGVCTYENVKNNIIIDFSIFYLNLSIHLPIYWLDKTYRQIHNCVLNGFNDFATNQYYSKAVRIDDGTRFSIVVESNETSS